MSAEDSGWEGKATRLPNRRVCGRQGGISVALGERGMTRIKRHVAAGSFPRRQGRHQDQAFTLVELLLVLVVMGVMAGIAVPRYANSLARQRVGAAAKRVVTDLTLARQHARLAGVTQSVLFTVTNDLYTLVEMPDPDHAGKEYSVALSREPYRSKVVAADFGEDAEVAFDLYGRPDSGGNVSLCAGDFCKIVAVDAETGKARVLTGSAEDLDPVPPEIKEQLPVLID